jgi:hypothetical protein
VMRYGAQLRLARALLDYFAGIDPSGAGVVGTLLTLVRNRGGRGRRNDGSS